jgi:thiol-disulfide isomerase/thioredoxin
LRRREVLSLGSASLALAAAPRAALAAAPPPPADRAAAYLRFVADQDRRAGAELPDFPAGAWFNAPPLSLARELRGRVLVLDFWTLCCVNCMHVLPELAALEAKYADSPVTVVGVHSPKFPAEGDDAAIRAAVLRYGVTHPVLNDAGKTMWRALGVDSWPTLAVVAPTGRLITMLSGEGHQRDLDDLIAAALTHYGAKGQLVQGRVPSALERDKDVRVLSSPLRRAHSMHLVAAAEADTRGSVRGALTRACASHFLAAHQLPGQAGGGRGGRAAVHLGFEPPPHRGDGLGGALPVRCRRRGGARARRRLVRGGGVPLAAGRGV